MDEESQRRVILSCSLTLTSEISSSQRSIRRALGARQRRIVCVGGLSSGQTEALWGWDTGGVG